MGYLLRGFSRNTLRRGRIERMYSFTKLMMTTIFLERSCWIWSLVSYTLLWTHRMQRFVIRIVYKTSMTASEIVWPMHKCFALIEAISYYNYLVFLVQRDHYVTKHNIYTNNNIKKQSILIICLFWVQQY